jgi:hypothetical protein
VLVLLETLSPVEEPCASLRSTVEEVLIVHRSMVAIVVIQLRSPLNDPPARVPFARSAPGLIPIARADVLLLLARTACRPCLGNEWPPSLVRSNSRTWVRS